MPHLASAAIPQFSPTCGLQPQECIHLHCAAPTVRKRDCMGEDTRVSRKALTAQSARPFPYSKPPHGQFPQPLAPRLQPHSFSHCSLLRFVTVQSSELVLVPTAPDSGGDEGARIDLNVGYVLMILPQVHLRKPCYDFYFL